MIHKDRVALITGANRGIGKQVAIDLAKQGVIVIVTSRNEEEGQETRKIIKDSGGKSDFFLLDVSKEKSLMELYEFIEGSYGKLEILVNNAGIFADKGNFFETGREEMVRTFETNVIGPLRLTQLFLPMMMKHNFGRIVNVSSGMGQLSDMDAGYPAYRISKTSINALTKMTFAETKGKNIKVNSVCPGWVKTDMGGPNASRSIEQGAETIVWAALLPDSGPNGTFLRDKKEIPW
ncbi:SDR family oxidoreductase [Leptospira idonii]|uniref:SDR family oxidoreductase n=1 Tax=Leptospira idonii TaxID=1193500 RepID=A0A4R9M0E2_9LEPT|nr:SDR family oxidoreductase [Leptospira idonii]TGN19391.1 SDR family oxidoreductase [Leptospira idonii]